MSSNYNDVSVVSSNNNDVSVVSSNNNDVSVVSSNNNDVSVVSSNNNDVSVSFDTNHNNDSALSIDYNVSMTNTFNASSFFDTEVEQSNNINSGNVYYKLKSKAAGLEETYGAQRNRTHSLGELREQTESSGSTKKNFGTISITDSSDNSNNNNISESDDNVSLLGLSSRENVDIENLKNEIIGLDDSPIGWYRVIQPGGVILRTDYRLLEGSWVTRLPYNSTVYVTLVRGQRISLSKPIYGWASLENHDGEKLFEKLHQDSREPSPDREISPYLKIQQTWTKRASTICRNGLSICSLQSRASTMSVGKKSSDGRSSNIFNGGEPDLSKRNSRVSPNLSKRNSRISRDSNCTIPEKSLLSRDSTIPGKTLLLSEENLKIVRRGCHSTKKRNYFKKSSKKSSLFKRCGTMTSLITPTVLEEFEFPDPSKIRLRTKSKSSSKSKKCPPPIMMSHSTIGYDFPAQSFTIDQDHITLKEINIQSKTDTDLQEMSVTYFGPNSTVYLVNHKITQKKFALKALDVSQSIHRKEIIHELKTLKEYKHKNIVELFDIHWSPKYNAVCFLLEWMDQGSLHEILKVHGPLPDSRVKSVGHDVLCGLEYLHSFGCIHNDIKPSNILLHNGVAKISDFGVSRNINDKKSELMQSGTFVYMSPERLEGRDYDTSADIWSFGLVMYELIKGASYYDSDLNQAIIVSVVCSGDLPDLSDEECGIINDLVVKCCVREKSSRATASILKKMLNNNLENVNTLKVT